MNKDLAKEAVTCRKDVPGFIIDKWDISIVRESCGMDCAWTTKEAD